MSKYTSTGDSGYVSDVIVFIYTIDSFNFDFNVNMSLSFDVAIHRYMLFASAASTYS